MRKEFVMRGKTEPKPGSAGVEVLNFSGFKPGMAYKITEFSLYPATSIGSTNNELVGSVTAAKVEMDPANPDFNNEGLIATAFVSMHSSQVNTAYNEAVINDTFLITQNLLLSVRDMSGENNAVNWQCRFESVKMSGPEEAVTNYKQFAISDE